MEARTHEHVRVWSIGHGTATTDELFRLLAGESIQILVDVRSNPYSQYVPQANREELTVAARAHGLEYAFRGGEIGGRPSDDTLLLTNGKPDYVKIEGSKTYRHGIDGLTRLASDRRVCILCSEEDPARCHRALLIGETLVREGCEVLHIRHDGTVESQKEMTLRRSGGQLQLF